MTIRNVLIGMSMGASLLVATNVMANPDSGNACMAGQPCRVHHAAVKPRPAHHVENHVEPRHVVHQEKPRAERRVAAMNHHETVKGQQGGQGQQQAHSQQQGQIHSTVVRKPGQSAGQSEGGDR